MTVRQYASSEADLDVSSSSDEWQGGIAYMVESRQHKNLHIVLNNVDACLPKTWDIWVFHSDENAQRLTEISQTLGRSLRLIRLSKDIENNADYNALLLNAEFWRQFPSENLLGFQVDSLLNIKQKGRLTELLAYDYVGAPWSEAIRQRWSYIPKFGGNGGICFSKKSARLTALGLAKCKRNSGPPHHQDFNEGIWFSHAFKEIGLKLPDYQQACSLMVESVYSEQPFAVHKPWLYLSADDYQQLVSQLPELELLRKGCGEKRKNPAQAANTVTDMRRFYHRYARACLASENYYEADLALQLCHDRFPKDAISYNLQALLASKLGLHEQALSFVEKALALKKDFNRALDNKIIIERALNDKNAENQARNNSLVGAPKRKYLLINSWGSGFGFDLLYLLQQLFVAEVTGREPVIYWGANSLYNSHPESDCFTDYFLPISDTSLSELRPFQATAFPEYWQTQMLENYLRRTRWRNRVNNQRYQITPLHYLERDERLAVSGEFGSIKTMLPWLKKTSAFYGDSLGDIYRFLSNKYLKPRPELVQHASNLIKQMFGDNAFYAIHLRGTDKVHEKQSEDIANINIQLIERLEALDQDKPIFVMSDDNRQVELAKERFGSRIKTIDVTRSDDDAQGVHHTAVDKSKIAHEVIVDMLIASKAHAFFGCGVSYLACTVAYRRDKSALTTLLPYDVTSRFNDIPYPGKYGIE